eukprot:1187450-Prorocentrum_minimum.AAC.1
MEDIIWNQKDGPCIFIEGQTAKCFTSMGKFVSNLTVDKLEETCGADINGRGRLVSDEKEESCQR